MLIINREKHLSILNCVTYNTILNEKTELPMQKFNINVRSVIQQIKFLLNIAQIYGNIGTLHVAITSTDNNGMIDLNKKALNEFRKIKPSMRIPLELLEMIYKSKNLIGSHKHHKRGTTIYQQKHSS